MDQYHMLLEPKECAQTEATPSVIREPEALVATESYRPSVIREPKALVATDQACGRRELRAEVTAGREPRTEVSAKEKL